MFGVFRNFQFLPSRFQGLAKIVIRLAALNLIYIDDDSLNIAATTGLGGFMTLLFDGS